MLLSGLVEDRPARDRGRPVADRVVARLQVVDRAVRADRAEQLAGDEAVEVALRLEDEERAIASARWICEPGRGGKAAHARDGRGQLLTELGVFARRCVAEGVADHQGVHATRL